MNERNIDPNAPMIALTYDDGPSLRLTPILLEELKKNNAVATFFLLGNNVEVYPDIAKMIVENGNEIGIHGYDHSDLSVLSAEELQQQMNSTREIIEGATGYTPVIMRPTYGFLSDTLRENVNMPIILWSIDTFDWANRNAETVYNSVIENVSDGDIILMHDINESTIEASKALIPELINRGYQLVTVSELSQYKGVPLEPGVVYKKIE
jgi:peptidoglycan/xylan/chitin deacetylase (PgdA/CDA1 family)